MTIHIDIEEQTLETRNKKGGGTYQVQTGYAHVFNRNGEPERYPERFSFFPPRDNSGNPQPLKPGKYQLAPQSIKVENGFLALGFPVLVASK